ncbi:hypothetical protein P3H15_55190, partial [Rhodococcus sp. T2V]|nr:hypothetical protein [Rhodococcus sp. T2V]
MVSTHTPKPGPAALSVGARVLVRRPSEPAQTGRISYARVCPNSPPRQPLPAASERLRPRTAPPSIP